MKANNFSRAIKYCGLISVYVKYSANDGMYVSITKVEATRIAEVAGNVDIDAQVIEKDGCAELRIG